MNFFTPNHVQLLNSAYPNTSTLLTAGPDYSPNPQELSRLTYYASNHPGKLSKIGGELEKRVKTECRKARAGNIRTRASLLISLAIFRSLATECRHNIALLSPSLMASLEATLSALPSDMEAVARAATVFTAWTTYTDGHLIGTDSNLTKDYLAVLRSFANSSCVELKDLEVRNRTRLIGFAGLTGALSSEALYNDSVQFKAQVSIIMRPILLNMLQTELPDLEQQSQGVKDDPISPYLAEFRTRPTIERRAASIHVHVDGDKGPEMADVSGACLRALFSLLEHVNGSQLGYILRSSFDNLDELKGWSKIDHCCWFTSKTAEWAQYQCRYAVPTWLVERLIEGQDAPTVTPMHKALTAMVTTVFNSPTPLINLSTSDIISNIMTLVVRRAALDPEDTLLPALVECITSLGRHVYYSDQIHDLTGELISRLLVIETQGITAKGKPNFAQSRSQAIRCFIAGILGLIDTANRNEAVNLQLQTPPRRPSSVKEPSPSLDATTQDAGANDRISRRARVPPDIWQESLGLLCDRDYAIRADYAEALVFYLVHEMPKSDSGDSEGLQRLRRLTEPPQGINMNTLLQTGDFATRFLSAIHAYLYILASAVSLDVNSSSSASSAANVEIPQVNILPATPQADESPEPPLDTFVTAQPNERRSFTPQPGRPRKVSAAFHILERTPLRISGSTTAYLSDYSNILNVVETIHEQLPVRGLVSGIPMLLALDGAAMASENDEPQTVHRTNVIKAVLAKAWLAIGRVWDAQDLVKLAEEALSSLPESAQLPSIPCSDFGVYHPPQQPQDVPATPADIWAGVDAESALLAIVSNQSVQEATGIDKSGLLRRFSNKWTVETALRDSIEKPAFDATVRGDGVSPLLKISPALMHIENISLQSLARSTRGVGVSDLREALEGRSSMSNPTLGRPSSISTLDHTSSIAGDSRMARTRSRTRSKKRSVPSGPGEVRDVLNKLGIGKQNGSLLKASFPALQNQTQRSPPYKS
ncbi:hypothetical protein C8J56DRAFT_934069 [Mycena floridula]|nr:hypothetical protein C8J56DRAFT_934069 [Mycena floridula]